MPDPASATEAERMQIDKLCGDLIAYGFGAGVSWPQSSDQLANYEKARKTRAELLAVVAALTSRREQQAHAAGVAEGIERADREVQAEPEMPGDMPDEMWAEIREAVRREDREALAYVLRTVVALTKAGISGRLPHASAGGSGGEGAERGRRTDRPARRGHGTGGGNVNEEEPMRTNEQILNAALALLEEYASRGTSNRARIAASIEAVKGELSRIADLRRRISYLAEMLAGELSYSEAQDD